MTSLTASEARIPPEHFNRVVYQGEVLQIERRDGPSVYVISEEDWKLLQAARTARDTAIDAAGDRAVRKYDELLRRLAQ